MSSDDVEQGFADAVGRHFARQNGLPPVTGRVVGWLLVCDPAQQTIAEVGQGLRASRSAIAGAVAQLEGWGWIQRTRAAGERVDRVELDPAIWVRLLDKTEEYTSLRTLAQRGLELLEDAPDTRRSRLSEAADFADFLAERMPVIAAEWRARRTELGTSGE
ncbi:GbsR/MarR family transcriptional regulator [Nocardia sp. NBC_00416]|uniref:GbsR/MarR family transcriptional regulator n=1 Tax=Nocardia sp. NBC_00416 TaxID=2975991 RepID=UPI002E1DC3D2